MTQWKIIGRGMAGWNAKTEGTSSSGGTVEEYALEAEDGTLVYDARFADEVEFTRHVVCGPLVGCGLAPEEVDRFNTADRERLKTMLPALEGEFKTIGTVALSEQYGGLDKVGLGIYERLLRAIPGKRMGKVVGGVAVWDQSVDELRVAKAHREHRQLGIRTLNEGS